MDYVSYCHRLVVLLVGTESQITYGGHTSITVDHLLHQLHVNAEMTSWDDPEALDVGAFRGALEAMIEKRYLEGQFKLFQVSSTPEGKAFAKNPMLSWAEICRRTLDPDSESVLKTINKQSECADETFSFRRWVPYDQLIHALGWVASRDNFIRLDRIIRDLHVEDFVVFGGSPSLEESKVCASYEGLVWTSRRDFVVYWSELDALVNEWETCNVDFKRELPLKTQDQKAEFVKDILGLVNTQASGRRWMVLGFDDKTRSQHVPPDPAECYNYQNRMSIMKEGQLQQILSDCTDPPVRIKLKHVRYRKGPIVLVEVFRDARLVPHQVSKKLCGAKRSLQPGDVFVRHGSVTEPPTALELQSLKSEADWARRGLATVESIS